MRYRHANKKLQRLDEDPKFRGGFSASIINSFRMRMQMIRDAENIQTFYALKSLHFEKLKGARSHQHSMRLNQQFRLIVELEQSTEGQVVVVIDIEGYH